MSSKTGVSVAPQIKLLYLLGTAVTTLLTAIFMLDWFVKRQTKFNQYSNKRAEIKNMVHLKVWKSRECRRGGWGGGHFVLGRVRKENLMMPEKMEQQGVAHILVLQHPGSSWNTAYRGGRRQEKQQHDATGIKYCVFKMVLYEQRYCKKSSI